MKRARVIIFVEDGAIVGFASDPSNSVEVDLRIMDYDCEGGTGTPVKNPYGVDCFIYGTLEESASTEYFDKVFEE